MSVGLGDEEKGKVWIVPSTERRSSTHPRTLKENQEQDHVSAWEISETHLTPMKTDVPTDFY